MNEPLIYIFFIIKHKNDEVDNVYTAENVN